MANSYVEYTANGSTNQFDITFSYIDRTHIKVYINNVEDTSFTFVNDNRIQTSSMPSNGQVVKVDRDTPTTARLVDFQDGSVLTETDLDKSANQNFFIAQETEDEVASKLGQNNSGVFDAINKRIINVGTPTATTDAATKTYVDAVAGSATAAASSATAAAASATAAAASETAAASSETAAASSETNAATSATSASNSASTATTKASEASTSASNASTSETNAASSASSASTSATTATTKASEASTSASNASTSETNASNSATAAATSATNAASSETNAATSATTATTQATTATTQATTATTQATNASTSATNAATSETNAASSATSAASSATTATTKASEASTSASNASTSETNASNSASAASTSATNAGNSATAAANSAAAAANSFDDFDDKYLGSKTSNPSLDNDGNALVSGALYFNSTANEMRVYDGANWIAASSAGTASLIIYEYTATSNQTTFSGSDDNSATLSYSVDNLQVSLNGVLLDSGDYTATSGTSIVLGSGAATGDLLTVYAFKSFTVAELNANNLNDGIIPDARFPATLPAISGANLTNLDASDLASGTVPIARLGSSGTKDSTTFLRGDNTFATVTSTTINNNADNRLITGSGTANTLEGEASLTFDGTFLVNTGGSNTGALRLQNGTTGSGSNDGLLLEVSGNAVYFNQKENDAIYFRTNNTDRFNISADGHLLPATTNQIDLGSSSKVWRNVYTSDFHMSNEGLDKGNDVDGTKGSWTFQEGEENLYLINNKNGKKYKFNLTEIE